MMLLKEAKPLKGICLLGKLRVMRFQPLRTLTIGLFYVGRDTLPHTTARHAFRSGWHGILRENIRKAM